MEALTKYSKSVLAGEIKTETRVYAIEEVEDIYEISDEKFIEIAEELGLVWSLEGFQTGFNCEGRSLKHELEFWKRGQSYYYIRFIDVEVG